MKILFIHNRYQYTGGEDKAVKLEADLLETRGHEVKVVYFDNNNISKASIGKALGSIYNFKSRLLINKCVNSFSPDIIHVHNLFFIASPSILKLAKRAGIPVVMTLHNYRLICCNALLLRSGNICELCVSKKFPIDGIKYKCYRSSALESALVTFITGIHKFFQTWKRDVTMYIALSDFARMKFLKSSLELSEEKITVLHNFEVDHGIENAVREQYFLYVGRITEEKGILLALRSFSFMKDQTLLVVGEGPLLDFCKLKYGDFSNIRFCGPLEAHRVRELMKKSKALIFPSIWYEGLPYTILESFATGTPIMAADIGTMATIIEEGVNGFHFKNNDSNDLIRCINNFNGLKETAYLYENARKTFECNYNASSHYSGLMNIYNKCLQKAEVVKI
ncbi:MAG: glycosyltransferase family 4 protein [Flavisolibacter sp.]